MKDELHRHLDGERSTGKLEPRDREEADAWDRMVASFRTAAPSGAAPPWLEQKVMAEIDQLSDRSLVRRLVDWVVRPTAIRVSPLMTGLVTAAFAWALLLPKGESTTNPDAPGLDPEATIVYVQFMLEAPTATTVAVAGDFNDWGPDFTLEDPDGDGVWTGRVPIRPGVHSYMFLIDGTEWQTDPLADRYRDDGFGNRNAILAVASGA
jgi:hypothetical protein